MKRLTPAFLLVSLVFNVTFIAGYLAFRASPMPPPNPERLVEAVADDLELTEKQRQKYAALHKQQQDESEKVREAIRLTREGLMTELSKPAADQARLQTLQNELSDLYCTERDTSVRYYGAFMEVLTPEQRQRVAERVDRHRRGHWRGHAPPWTTGKWLERFDASGDGELDEGERAKAREAMLKDVGPPRPWSRDFGPPAPPEMMPVFKTMRGVRSVMRNLTEDQKAKVQQAMKKITGTVEAFEADLAQILTAEQMQEFRKAKDAPPPWGSRDRGGPPPMGPPGRIDEKDSREQK